MGRHLFGKESLDRHSIQKAATMPMPRGVFFVKPDYFDVDHALNPHMLDADGKPHKISKSLADEQWQALKEVYQGLGLQTKVLAAKQGCPDMVFCANQSFPYLDQQGRPSALMSNMADDTRHAEVESIADSLKNLGFQTSYLPERTPTTLLEGMGDALWVPGKRFICGGYGFRTHASIYESVSRLVDAPILALELKNPKFYHLDTCLSILNETTILACREAFQDSDWQALETVFDQIIMVPLVEADSPGFACNAHCPDGKHVILQQGNPETERLLELAGFTPIPLDTSEFIKSGGSVFCMKQIYF
ncbi:dimethylarginine dimethylaminohydrolase family protein [Pseudobacteriovorax antillogorgiicola]|uniref:N-Dimethylarginine dimethylaminohydrolase n=1 Tax=Pseudobacteriovorax antillogorgiicola TaxID=1513793 RepID=A0A1Y6BZX4_9BACT|nr:arginine deiminase-related protein [Pseudobacteriovorax antillogorgiicola]TCS52376.1 N-dimethylarginine dimethylaminohydrolase [Pseudobacteriovorax antillogorgiicola]SMF29306.1 N-Dimethylarginine dimethylaminohydrolase [Pseudobacteriovorax antillogorgiicola]